MQYFTVLLYQETPKYQLDLEEIHQLKWENIALKDTLLHFESYTFIASEAASEGFVPGAVITP